VSSRLLLRRSLFVDPPDGAARLWAIDLAARCPAVAAVVADGRGLRLAHTRRLQLAAERSGSLVLLARPPGELRELSVAGTRWRLERTRSSGANPRWRLELLRCKGSRRGRAAGGGGARSEGSGDTNAATEAMSCSGWMLEWDRVQGAVCLPADVVDRPDPAAAGSREEPGRRIA
ncbi:MAG: hypothetical protein ACYTGG_06560, partial [Planctomycetota bacterium]|jgi:hypothetical protein